MSTNAFYFDGTNSITTTLFPGPAAVRQFTWCGFIAPDEDPTTANFKGLLQIGDAEQAILYMQSLFSVGVFRLSVNDESPDIDSGLNWVRNAWYFVSITYAITASDGSSADFGITVKPVRTPNSRLDADDSDVGAITWIRSKTGGGGDYQPVTSGSTTLYFGISGFGEQGASAQCGHRYWDHRLTLAEIERESGSIRAIKRAGLLAEYPMQSANDFKDYSGRGNTLTASGTIAVRPGPPLLPRRIRKRRSIGTVHYSIPYSFDIAAPKQTIIAQSASYATSFDSAETPLSEAGAWQNNLGLDWTQINTNGGIAYGTQGTGPNGPPYNDSIAHLLGFPPNHGAQGVVSLSPSIDVLTTHEAEILVRWASAPHFTRGYEFNYAYNGAYCGWVRWNGLFNDFTPLGDGTPVGALVTGAILRGEIVGTTLSAYVNLLDGNGFQLVHQVTDSTWTDGNPGMGFWRGGGTVVNGDIAYKRYWAYSL